MMRRTLLAGLLAFMLAGMSQVAEAGVVGVDITFEAVSGPIPCSDPDYDWEWEYDLHIVDMGGVAYLNDYEIECPKIDPGYVHIIPPENWTIDEFWIGRVGFDATDPVDEEVHIGGWIFQAKYPEVSLGTITVTQDGAEVGCNCAWIPTPEPATLALLGVGLAGLLARRRK